VSRLSLVALLLLGCHAPGESSSPEPELLAPDLQYAFDELKAAVEEDSDDAARAILVRLRPRCTDPLSARIAAGYGRVLFGRAVRDAVRGQVVVREVEGGFGVGLQLEQGAFETLTLTPGHVRVEWAARSLDVGGRQSVQIGGRVIESPGSWELPDSEVVHVQLGEDSPKMGEGFLAVRCEWRVSLGAGSSVVAEERFPTQGIEVLEGVVVRLAKELPTDIVPPVELIRYALGAEIRMPALLERAVRIPPGSYGESLDLFGEREGEFSPARLQELVPALVWLAGASRIESSGEDWRIWLKDRLSHREGEGNLDLPGRTPR